MSTQIVCPNCGATSYFEELGREADAFCRVCDFPLFWSRGERVLGGGEGGNVGLRRLPGTAGRVDVATVDCPACEEPNPVTRTICIRCGAELRPAPLQPEPEPALSVPSLAEPEPAVEPARSWAWLWVLLGVAAVVALVLLVVLLTVK
ncbi:MAG TPA: hypothetical protein VMD28_09265 [Acidimicrobiales bacterium]|nr:hypothetical protein [Acidimicrobiales bacterium]